LKKLPEITVKTVPSSEIIVINVTANSPKLAANTANTIANIITTKSQASANQSDPSSQELKILTARQTELQNELSQARQEHQKLVLLNAQTTAQMQVLDRTIRMKETTFQNLQGQYQQAVVNENVATYASTKVPAQKAMKIYGDEMAALDTDLTAMRQQYQDLATHSATYTQQIISAGQTVQNIENGYQNLLTQIDSARVANSKQESAQDVMIASAAVPPLAPTGPGSALIIGIGFAVGLLGGLLVAFLIHTLDTRIDTTEQVQRMTGLPILGRLPTMNHNDSKAPWQSKDINVQRAVGTLCTKILAIQRANPAKTILITSPNPREGKSLITLAIAEGIAQSNRKVLVIDMDWRRSGLIKQLNASPSQCGLPGLLRGECRLEDAVQVFSNPGVHFLLNGLEDVDPNPLFHKPAFAEMMQHLDAYDLVLFDSPALLDVPDAYNLAMKMDGVILVVQRKRTKVEDVEAMLSQLEDVKSKLLGTIVNRVPLKRVSGYYQRKSVAVPGGITKPV
jgi:polysaccharide biosynthesis transport protein